MRVSTQMMQRIAVDGLLERQSTLSRTQQQLATGKRILSPSDDPTGTTQALAFKQQLVQNEQYNSNINRLKSRLESEESVLEGVGNTLIRVRELAVQGSNNNYDLESRTILATEVRLLLDEALQLANSKDGSGEYLFSGYQSQTQPFTDAGLGNYTYNGDQTQRRIQISSTRDVASSDPGSEVFQGLDIVAGGKQNIFKTLYDFATDLEANNAGGNILADIDTALSAALTTRAKVGARINAVDAQEQINLQYETQTKAVLSEIEDLDFAEAIGRLNLELAGLQAAQQSFQRIQNLSLFSVL